MKISECPQCGASTGVGYGLAGGGIGPYLYCTSCNYFIKFPEVQKAEEEKDAEKGK